MNTETESVTVVKRGLDSPTLTCVLTEICINLCLLSANTTKLENALQHGGDESGCRPKLNGIAKFHTATCKAHAAKVDSVLSHMMMSLDVKPQQQYISDRCYVKCVAATLQVEK